MASAGAAWGSAPLRGHGSRSGAQADAGAACAVPAGLPPLQPSSSFRSWHAAPMVSAAARRAAADPGRYTYACRRAFNPHVTLANPGSRPPAVAVTFAAVVAAAELTTGLYADFDATEAAGAGRASSAAMASSRVVLPTQEAAHGLRPCWSSDMREMSGIDLPGVGSGSGRDAGRQNGGRNKNHQSAATGGKLMLQPPPTAQGLARAGARA